MLRLAKRTAELALSKVSPRYKINYQGKGLINLIDVGSVGGLPRPWRENANSIRFLLNFEPNDSPQAGVDFTTYNTAVWEKDETRPFYIYGDGTGSSLFRQNFDYVKSNLDALKTRGPRHLAETWIERSSLKQTTEIKCRSLDNVLREFQTRFHFLKIDAQGAEYQILKGASDLLSGPCIGLYLELFTIPLYEGIKLLPEVQSYLSDFGFELIKKFPAHGSFDSQHDCLFLKNSQGEELKRIKYVYGLTP